MPSDTELFAKLKALIGTTVPQLEIGSGFGGTGGYGLITEYLLGISANNRDTPDSGTWEVKTHGGKSLLTLFHKKPENGTPSIRSLVKQCGWVDEKGRRSFRHTLKAQSERGFYVAQDGNRIVVRNDEYPDILPPYWTHDTLVTAFAYKLRRLALITGTRHKKRQEFTYKSIRLYVDAKPFAFLDAIKRGIVAIDFDAREMRPGSDALRNHGTKFRIAVSDLHKLYEKNESFGEKKRSRELNLNPPSRMIS